MSFSREYLNTNASYKDLDGTHFSIDIQKKDNDGNPIGGTQSKQLYVTYCKENNSFKLHQRHLVYGKRYFGSENISPEVVHRVKTAAGSGYCEFVAPGFSRDYLMVDASSLKTLIEQGTLHIKEQDRKDQIDELAQQEQEDRKQLVEELKVPKEVLHSSRIFRSKNQWKVCIDRGDSKYLQADNDQMPALVSYLKGETFLRRAHNLLIDPFPVSHIVRRRVFKDLGKAASGPVFIIDGADDTANGIIGSGVLDERVREAFKAFGLFPPFLSLVGFGVKGLADEKGARKEAVAQAEENRLECIEKLSNIQSLVDEVKNLHDERYSEEKKSELFDRLIEFLNAIAKLQESLSQLVEEKDGYRSAAYMGHPAMIAMFSGVLAYELEALVNLFGGIPIISKGLESVSFAQKLNIHGGVLGENLPAGIGAISASGNGLILGGQILMAGFAINKMIAEAKKIKQTTEELKNIQQSDMMSDYIKQVSEAFKKDERLYSIMNFSGNGSLALGQALMALFGPIGLGMDPGTYVGLGLTLFGIGLNTSTDLRKAKLYDHDEEPGPIEQAIFSKMQEEMMQGFVEEVKVKQIKDIIDEIKEEDERFQDLTESDLEEIFREAKAHNGYRNAFKAQQNAEKALLKREFSAVFQDKCQASIHFTNKDGGKYTQSKGMRTKSVLDYINRSSLYSDNSGKDRYNDIARQSSFQMELLAHLQSVGLVVGKVIKEASKKRELFLEQERTGISVVNRSYNDAFETAEGHYASRRHQVGLLNTLRCVTLPSRLKEIIDSIDTDQKDKMVRLAIWHKVTDALKPKGSDLPWLRDVGKELAKSKTGTSIADIAQSICNVRGLPEEIKDGLSSQGDQTIDYQGLIEIIQNGFAASRFKNIDFEQYANMSTSAIKKEVSLDILDGELSNKFKARVMQHTYVEENRWSLKPESQRKAKYEAKSENSPIHVTGTVVKIDKVFGIERSHTKRVYGFNKAAIEEGGFTPKTETFKSFLKKTVKQDCRSTYQRCINSLENKFSKAADSISRMVEMAVR